MSHLVITISRQFGSGGRYVGEKLSQALGIPIYDRSVIEMAAEKSGISAEYMEQAEKDAANKFLYNLRTATYTPLTYHMVYELPPKDKAYFAQAAVIKEIAERESCIIVGRCADHVLAGRDNLMRLFIYGDMDARMKYAVANYGIKEGDAKSTITKIDKGRANYYQFYTGKRWSEIHNYDLLINTSSFGVEPCIDGLIAMIKDTQK